MQLTNCRQITLTVVCESRIELLVHFSTKELRCSQRQWNEMLDTIIDSVFAFVLPFITQIAICKALLFTLIYKLFNQLNAQHLLTLTGGNIL